MRRMARAKSSGALLLNRVSAQRAAPRFGRGIDELDPLRGRSSAVDCEGKRLTEGGEVYSPGSVGVHGVGS